MRDDLPDIIREVGFDFSWDEKKVWALDESVAEMDIAELAWHFDIPFLGEGGTYNLTPRAVMEHPDEHPGEYERTVNADMQYPIDVMEHKGRWLMLDGLHRLMKTHLQGRTKIRVRKIPRSRIPEILR